MKNTALSIRPIRHSDLRAAIALAARAMSDNALHRAVFGRDRRRRERLLRDMFELLLADGRQVWGAYQGAKLLGVIAYTTGSGCLPSPRALVRYFAFGLRAIRHAPQLIWWFAAWARKDPKDKHWHLGPLAVTPELQGRGIGTALMRHYLQRLDQAGACGYLETDSAPNVRFYESFQFRTAIRTRVGNVANWFMVRRPD